MKKSLAEWAGVNVLSALGLSLSGDRSATNLHCGVMHFDVKDGVMGSQQIVLDTDPTRIDGHGTVDLKDETVNLTLEGKPKHFQLLHLNAPITLTGKLQSPAIGVDTKPALTQGALGLGLGLLSPFAAIFAFVDPGLAKDAIARGSWRTPKSRARRLKRPRKAPIRPKARIIFSFCRLRIVPSSPSPSRGFCRKGKGMNISKALPKFLAVLGLALALAGCGINAIPAKDQAVKARWADVQAAYQRRSDLIPNLVTTVQGYAAQEKVGADRR